jgi:MFS family permease
VPRGPLDRREWKLLALLGTAGFFRRYDQSLLALLLVQIQAELGLPEGAVGGIGSFVRLGALPALGFLFAADRIGRRRLLLGSIVGYTALTAATALAPNAVSFVVCQFLAQIFLTVEFGLALVVAVEELRPGNRGFGVGVLGTLSLLGTGAAMIGFGFVESLPFGWRTLYAAGVIPLVLVAFLRRGLPETGRFRALSREARATSPLRTLWRRHRRRLVAAAAVAFLWQFSNASVDFFLPKFAQEVHGWTPAHYATVAVLGGALGLSGQLLAGWLSDRRGRRGSALVFLTLEPLLAVALYSVGPAVFVPAYIGWVFASVANDVLGRTYQGELFPTSARATALGGMTIFATAGGVAGLAAEAALFAVFGAHWTPVRIVAATGLAIPLIVAAAYPETSGRSLEEIAPDGTTAEREAMRDR